MTACSVDLSAGQRRLSANLPLRLLLPSSSSLPRPQSGAAALSQIFNVDPALAGLNGHEFGFNTSRPTYSLIITWGRS